MPALAPPLHGGAGGGEVRVQVLPAPAVQLKQWRPGLDAPTRQPERVEIADVRRRSTRQVHWDLQRLAEAPSGAAPSGRAGAPAPWPTREDMGMVEQAIEQGGDGGRVAEEFAPVFDRAVVSLVAAQLLEVPPRFSENLSSEIRLRRVVGAMQDLGPAAGWSRNQGWTAESGSSTPVPSRTDSAQSGQRARSSRGGRPVVGSGMLSTTTRTGLAWVGRAQRLGRERAHLRAELGQEPAAPHL